MLQKMEQGAEVLVRGYCTQDREGLEAMAREVVQGGAEFVFETVEEVLAYWLGPRTHTFVLELDGQLAGSYALKPNQPGRGAHVANAGYMVARAFRRRGLAALMGEHSLNTARALGFRSIQFNMVVSTNEAAVRAWRHLGFDVVGQLPRVFRHPSQGLVDALVMARDL